VLTCYGEHDPFLSGRPGLMKALPEAHHILMEGVSHYPAWDVPERITELMLTLRS